MLFFYALFFGGIFYAVGDVSAPLDAGYGPRAHTCDWNIIAVRQRYKSQPFAIDKCILLAYHLYAWAFTRLPVPNTISMYARSPRHLVGGENIIWIEWELLFLSILVGSKIFVFSLGFSGIPSGGNSFSKRTGHLRRNYRENSILLMEVANGSVFGGLKFPLFFSLGWERKKFGVEEGDDFFLVID